MLVSVLELRIAVLKRVFGHELIVMDPLLVSSRRRVVIALCEFGNLEQNVLKRRHLQSDKSINIRMSVPRVHRLAIFQEAAEILRSKQRSQTRVVGIQ